MSERIARFGTAPGVVIATLVTVGIPASSPSPARAQDARAVLSAPAYSVEGMRETIEVRFDREIHAPVVLEIYTFHYPMHPELALEEDTWTHEEQMRRRDEVLSGLKTPYAPDPEDPRVAAILAASTVERSEMASSDHRVFSKDWKATHGRIFFKARAGEQPLEAIASARVHCAHVDLRSVEKLKETLSMLELPLAREHGEVADGLVEQVRSVYGSGHGFRHMLLHHQLGLGDLDVLLGRLGKAVEGREWQRARLLVDRLQTEIVSRQRAFLDVKVEGRGDRLRITSRIASRASTSPRTQKPRST